jgi:hypothetical protein
MKESKKKSRPEGQDGSESESCGIDGDYWPTIFSTMLPMIGSLYFSWL